MIEKRTDQIAEQFNITYLNGLNEMRDSIKSFQERQSKMDAKNLELKEYIAKELA
jgi:hypothetical protein